MQKKLLMALLAIFSLSTIAKADVTEAISHLTYTEVNPPKQRKQTDHFFLFGLQGGVSTCKYWSTRGGYDYDEWYPAFSAVLGYKHQIRNSNFMVGGQLTLGGSTADHRQLGFFFDVAPTISYMYFPGGFYNSFEATLGLGLGYRQGPSDTFAFVPELNFTYWFNWFGIGATARYSLQKSHDYEVARYDYFGDSYYYSKESVSGNQFSAAIRFAVRF